MKSNAYKTEHECTTNQTKRSDISYTNRGVMKIQ